MTTTKNETPETITLFGKTLKLRGSKDNRASWRGEHDGIVLYVYRSAIGAYTAKISVRNERLIDPVAAAEATTLELAESELRATLGRLGFRI